MTHDRTYWRQCATKTLIDAAKDSPDELAIALGERLGEYQDTSDTIDDLLQDNKALARDVAGLEKAISELQTEIDQLRFAAKF